MKHRLPNIILVVLFIGALTFGLARTIFLPKSVNEYENRPANKFPAISAGAFMDRSFQEGVDSSLSDQIPFSESLKKLYNDINSAYLKFVTDPLRASNRNKYMEMMGMKIFDGEYFCKKMFSLDDKKTQIDSCIATINSALSRSPDVKAYGYYVEKDEDLDLTTGERSGGYEYIKEKIALDRFERFEVDSADTYKQIFFKTDHHWNKDGSYKAYTELLKLLEIDEAPIVPNGTKVLTEEFSGAYAKGKGIAGYYERLTVNTFDYSPQEIYINGEKTDKYGRSDTDFSYGGWYGADKGLTVFKNDAPDKENLLVIGDSYDNAVLELLSAHCNSLHSVDPRYNKEFLLSDYIEEHDIDKVLFIGCIDFYAEDKNI
ncbi:MAG: hypothetical protein IJ408_06270 [Clostridia bacterium]|nr:hypothetical protein [Clostridia bacterium]